MLTLKGRYAEAKVFTDTVDELTLQQIQSMIDHDITENTQVRIMPDCHLGKGSTVGTTIKFDGEIDKVVPNIVGVDIGCGILMHKLDYGTEIDFKLLDRKINKLIPSGFEKHDFTSNSFDDELGKLLLPLSKDTIRMARQSIGTLGGGNHYIEVAEDEQGSRWLSVHSGSRNLGHQIATYYQKLAVEEMSQKLGATHQRELVPLKGKNLTDYLNDMQIAQKFAALNRKTMLERITREMNWKIVDCFDSIHNFIDLEHKIIRKGATSAQKAERLVIPLNMRDGSLICEGLGNEDWNYSAPHGAGRELSRSQAKKRLDFKLYQEQMKNVYTSSVVRGTLDEAPDAYKPVEQIIGNISDTVVITHRLKPLYNFKAH
ncbi:RtcB family protein [Vagococcus elongatus]|uniref:3'-phosphate/5'-hydroxy nucleic acid ligase n=1 Tax=Vagococcus elongatus TaxID=180344 RepID=A0A430B639_9ENTE|nr:RtcB family protein [Vagococcus elongatus]RSU15775.1 hypothetical protein CBF29_01215 [Vagococcus elongatus]